MRACLVCLWLIILCNQSWSTEVVNIPNTFIHQINQFAQMIMFCWKDMNTSPWSYLSKDMIRLIGWLFSSLSCSRNQIWPWNQLDFFLVPDWASTMVIDWLQIPAQHKPRIPIWQKIWPHCTGRSGRRYENRERVWAKLKKLKIKDIYTDLLKL